MRPFASASVALIAASGAEMATAPVPLPATCASVTPSGTEVLIVSLPCSTESATSTVSPPASTSAIEMPVSGVSVSCTAVTGPIGRKLTGASLTASTVIDTVRVSDTIGRRRTARPSSCPDRRDPATSYSKLSAPLKSPSGM